MGVIDVGVAAIQGGVGLTLSAAGFGERGDCLWGCGVHGRVV